MKIGIIKETKIPEDNRVALTPELAKKLMENNPGLEIIVQPSSTRAYSDEEYKEVGIKLSEDLSDCDLLLGIKEAQINTLIPNKKYMFFGHIAKMQEYNKPLFKDLIDKNITFTDYEYLVDDNGNRLVAFGWYAGVVGLYYTLRGWGIRNKSYDLPQPHIGFSIEELVKNLKNVDLGNARIVITGRGRVSQGAQYILKRIGAKELTKEEFISLEGEEGIEYCVASLSDLVANNVALAFDRDEFKAHPENYHSIFKPYAKSADILLSCHFWANGEPVYLDQESFRNKEFRIQMIGDITCDIMGSIKSTLRSTTHKDPFFDYNPYSESEEPAFSNPCNVTVMAVDTCPNALSRETSQNFGENLIKYVLDGLINNIDRKSVV